jgi:hypothetical protein
VTTLDGKQAGSLEALDDLADVVAMHARVARERGLAPRPSVALGIEAREQDEVDTQRTQRKRLHLVTGRQRNRHDAEGAGQRGDRRPHASPPAASTIAMRVPIHRITLHAIELPRAL